MRTNGHMRMLRVTPLLALLVSLQLSSPALANSYLSELEAEANNTGEQPQTTAKPNGGWPKTKQRLSSQLDDGLSHEEFEQSLRDNYYGSFIFYNRLSDWNKKQVYASYQKNNDIEMIRNEIKNRLTK